MKNKKAYLILLISNVIFYLIFVFIANKFLIGSNSLGAVAIVLNLLPVFFGYIILYGIISYKMTLKIIPPNLILLLTNLLLAITLLFLGSDDKNYSNIFGCVVWSLICTFVSVFSASITQAYLNRKKKEEKADEKQEALSNITDK
jgi:hypothetical protein